MCGTPSYLAPEVVLQVNQEGYDNLVDSWSVGTIVFAMYAFSFFGLPCFRCSFFWYLGWPTSRPLTKIGLNKISELESPTVQLNGVLWTNVTFLLMVRTILWNDLLRLTPFLAKDFIYALLQTDPRRRMTMTHSLHHDWLRSYVRLYWWPQIVRSPSTWNTRVPVGKSHCTLYHSLFFTLKNRYIAISSHCIQFLFTTFTIYKFNSLPILEEDVDFCATSDSLASWVKSYSSIRILSSLHISQKLRRAYVTGKNGGYHLHCHDVHFLIRWAKLTVQLSDLDATPSRPPAWGSYEQSQTRETLISLPSRKSKPYPCASP